MNDEERIISPDDIFNQQIQDQEEISPYVNEPVKEKLTLNDLTKGLKNFLKGIIQSKNKKNLIIIGIYKLQTSITIII